jgi:hypothetical protein
MTKKTFIALTLLLLPLCSMAQRQTPKKAKAPAPAAAPQTTGHTIEYNLDNYHFAEAESQLQKSLAALRKRKQTDAVMEAQLAVAEKGKVMLGGTQKVVIIDSFIVARDKFLEKYKLSKSAGNIDTYDHIFGTNDSTDCMAYITAIGNKCYFSRPTLTGGAELCTCDLVGGKWSEPTKLQGLGSHELQNYPFLLADGITLYYAADSKETLGGYDIYVTRYNSDTKQFLKPENIGMPFNSPANDYMYAVDEQNQLGWFATDRNQADDKVCIYVFIPTTTREVYDYDGGDKLAIARAARIASIADTWADKQQVGQARQRLQALLDARPANKSKADYTFVINDRLTYTADKDFHSPEARRMMAWYKESKADWTKLTTQLDNLRMAYSGKSASERAQLAPQILDMEKKCEQLQSSLRSQEKKIRNTENAELGNK